MRSPVRARFLPARARNVETRVHDRWPRGSQGQSLRIEQPGQAEESVRQPKSCVDVRSQFECTATQSQENSATGCGGEPAGKANPGFHEARSNALPEST